MPTEPKTAEPIRFFLQAIDPDYGCPVLEAMFVVDHLAQLRVLLGPSAEDDPELWGRYDIEAGELDALRERFGVAFEPGGREVALERWHSLRDVPYLVHTNYELFLLIDGTKSFATMGDAYPPHRHFDEALFDRFVTEGLLHKEVVVEPFAAPITNRFGNVYDGMRHVHYARKGEEWRIRAWTLLLAAAAKSRWNDDFERLQGMLFGYEDWQMDWWMTHRRERRAVNAPEARHGG